MPRLPHGEMSTTKHLRAAGETAPPRARNAYFAFADVRSAGLQQYDFLFADLQSDQANLLPESRATRENLVRLGQTMRDTSGASDGDSSIPAAYTYFGQFVDHDITLETASVPLPKLIGPDLSPLSLADIRERLRNLRSTSLDLDSVYDSPAERRGEKMQIGKVTMLSGTDKPLLRPPGKDDENDLPREGRSGDVDHDRSALTGDPRNDENLVIQQLHVAFLRAHNALVHQRKTFDETRALLRRHYHHIVIHDFLKRIADPQIVNDILKDGNHYYDALAEPFFLPLEFTVAAYRFGHSMVRAEYDFNLNFNRRGGPGVEPATLRRLFTCTALSGQLGDFDTLPDNWIIEWENFVDVGGAFNKARRIDTKLVEPLFQLPDLRGIPEQGDGARLAVRNLLRGYLLRMPTGQAVARAIGQEPLPPKAIEEAAAIDEQVKVLREGKFLERTPLWYYILAEAANARTGRLGRMGSTLVAEVLIGLVRRSEDSILSDPGWSPTLGATPGQFTLPDLLRLGGVLSAEPK